MRLSRKHKLRTTITHEENLDEASCKYSGYDDDRYFGYKSLKQTEKNGRFGYGKGDGVYLDANSDGIFLLDDQFFDNQFFGVVVVVIRARRTVWNWTAGVTPIPGSTLRVHNLRSEGQETTWHRSTSGVDR